MGRPRFNSPHADPLDGYIEFRELVESDQLPPDADEDFEDGFVECDWCSRRATMTTPSGFPICQQCAEEAPAIERE